MQPVVGAPGEVHVTVRTNEGAGLFDLATISDIGIAAEESISGLSMAELKSVSQSFWPEQGWRERLYMLKRASPTSRERWSAAQKLAGAAARSGGNRYR